MPLDETFMNTSIEGNEPHVTSPDPAERKLARQLRIKRRLEAAAKRRQCAVEELKGEEEGDVSTPSTPVKKTNLEVQVATSNNAVFDAIDQGIEAVTNVLVAGNAYEVRRREDEAAVREARIKHLETEAEIAKEKFIAITAKWEEISTYIDPLDLFEETENQKDKCKELLALKDAVIHRLKEELKAADLRFLKDQDKQTAEVNLLVTRINEQIKIMKRIIRNQLTIIENAVETERNEIIEAFNKKWENLNKQRERDQVHNLEEKMLSLDEHHHNMDRIMVEHHEMYRSMKISLEIDIQALQQEVEHVKSVCLLNKEKIDYNYQVLKKRDEENLLIKSQQKRRINKLQDIATKLRRRISEMTENSSAEIKRLRAEVIRLHQKIIDIEKKSRRFSSVNEIKYNEVWQFNKERANQLLKKIMEMDRVIYEQILGLEWTTPEEYVKFMNSEKQNESQDKGNMLDEERSLNFEETKVMEMSINQRKLQLVRHLLSLIADSAGFLIEDRLQELLLPYSEPQKTLVCLHNIFNALGLKHHQDIQILANVLEPYVHCLTCEKRKSKPTGEKKETFSSIASTASTDPTTTETRRVQTTGILAQITEMVTQQVSMIHSVVNEVTTMRTESSISNIQSDESLSLASDMSVDEYIEDNESQSSVDTRIVLSLKSEEEADNICEGDVCVRLDKDNAQEHSHHHRHEPDAPSKIESPQGLAGVDSTFDEAKRDSSRIECKNPLHNLTIEPIYVLRALKEFVCQSEFYKSEMPITLKEKLSLQHANEGFKFSEEDVSSYWESYKNLFSHKQEKLWDALLLGLNKYHEVLLERHLVNVEVQRLKSQNHDLKRLLQHYTIPNVIKKDVKIFEESEIELPLINPTELSNISMCVLRPTSKKDRNA